MIAARALVFGGTGAVGSEVLRGLARANVATAFTYHRSRDAALALAAELSATPLRVDLREPAAVRELIRGLDREGCGPDVFIHCAGVSRAARLAEVTDEDWEVASAVNCRSAFVACQELAPILARRGEGHIVLIGAMDRSQSLPMPVHFAATQGMLAAMTMALAKELGPSGTRVNMVALGVLDRGISRDLDPKLLADYQSFSALRRVGTPQEAARAILWLALQNRYMSGQVLAVNGGI